MASDRAQAEALRIAYENLIRLGWKFAPEDIGKQAAKILNAMSGETHHAE